MKKSIFFLLAIIPIAAFFVLGATVTQITISGISNGGSLTNINFVGVQTNFVGDRVTATNLIASGIGGIIGDASVTTNNVNAQSANYNIAAGDTYVLLSANKTATLPTAVGIPGKVFTIKCTGNGTNAILTTSSQTIDGAAKWTNTAQFKFTSVVSDGANWQVIGQN